MRILSIAAVSGLSATPLFAQNPTRRDTVVSAALGHAAAADPTAGEGA